LASRHAASLNGAAIMRAMFAAVASQSFTAIDHEQHTVLRDRHGRICPLPGEEDYPHDA
jgi:hypothetical protein